MNKTDDRNIPTVSIGLPVYNGAQYIRNALDSLLAQTFADFELIVSDNASSDETQIICEQYVRQDSRVRYIRQSVNIGPVRNFALVQEQAKGEFFMWAAHDDLWHEDHIAVLMKKHASGCLQLVSSRPEYMELKTGKKFDFKEIRADLFSEDIQSNYQNFLQLHHFDYAKATMIYGLYRRDGMPSLMQIPTENERELAAVGADIIFLCSVLIKKPVAYIEQATWIRGERFYRKPSFRTGHSRLLFLKKILYRLVNSPRAAAIRTLIAEVEKIYTSRFPVNARFKKILSDYENEIIDLLLIDKSIVVKAMGKSFIGRLTVKLYRNFFASANPYIKSPD